LQSAINQSSGLTLALEFGYWSFTGAWWFGFEISAIGVGVSKDCQPRGVETREKPLDFT